MKVALLSHEGGGISSVSFGLAKSLSKKKIETTIFSTAADRKIRVEKINDYLEVIRLPLIDCPPRSLWFHLRNSSTLLRLLEDYTLIHAISPEMAIPYTLFGKNLRRPLITTLHGSHRAALRAFVQSPIKSWVLSDFAFHVIELPLHEMITRRCMAKSNRVVVCSFTTLNELKMYGEVDVARVSVIYNGVDFSEIQKEEAEIRGDDSEGELSIMFAGRLFWMKGITFVLRAFENVRKQFGNVQLRIFGKGPLESEIKRFIVSKGLKKDVYFGGFLPHRELIGEIKRSDVVVFPSLYESQPMFALETMACKKTLVAFDLPYAREIIKNGHSGLLAEAFDEKDFSDKILLALQDRKLRLKLGENAYEYVKKNHDWDTQTEKYLKVYEKVMNE